MTGTVFLEHWPAQLIRLDETGSTNEDAADRLAQDAKADFAIVARRQSAGRGRGGKVWQSPDGNLYLSAVIVPEVTAARAGELAFVTALAVADTVAECTGRMDVQVKWPNDVLLEDRKIAGILIENHIESGAIAHSIIGIGINVAVAPDTGAFPTNHIAAYRQDATARAVLDHTLSALRQRFRQWRHHGFGPIRDAWLQRAWRIDQPVSVETPEGQVTGIMAGIDERGALLISNDEQNTTIHSGSLAYGMA